MIERSDDAMEPMDGGLAQAPASGEKMNGLRKCGKIRTNLCSKSNVFMHINAALYIFMHILCIFYACLCTFM